MNLKDYLHNPMKVPQGLTAASFPMADEVNVSYWRRVIDSGQGSVLDTIGSQLPQVLIPIREGISSTEAYKNVVFQGVPFCESQFGEQTPYVSEEDIQLSIRSHFAGSTTVIETKNRADFIHLNRACSAKCEPVVIPEGVHADFVSGIPCPGRMHTVQQEWEEGELGYFEGESWGEAMSRLLNEDKSYFYDRLILMHDAPYGNVPANHVDSEMSDAEWLCKSAILRCEHEMTHDATRRILGSTRLNIHDEFIADFMGFTKALGTFSAPLFLEAMGISHGACPTGARFWHYTKELNKKDQQEILRLTFLVAEHLDTFSKEIPPETSRVALLLSLAEHGLPSMASDEFITIAKSSVVEHIKFLR